MKYKDISKSIVDKARTYLIQRNDVTSMAELNTVLATAAFEQLLELKVSDAEARIRQLRIDNAQRYVPTDQEIIDSF